MIINGMQSKICAVRRSGISVATPRENDDHDGKMPVSHRKSRFRLVGLPFAAGLLALAFGFGVNAFLPTTKLSGTFLRYAESRDASGKTSYYPLFAIEHPPGKRIVKAAIGAGDSPRVPQKNYPLLCILKENKIVKAETMENPLTSIFYVLFPNFGFVALAGLFFIAAVSGWRKCAAARS